MSAVLLVAALMTVPATARDGGVSDVRVDEAGGTYSVSATFLVSERAAVAQAVLTDYEGIPRFMPNVRTSRILQRHGTRVVVEQEAVARLLMFSRRIHLVLEIDEEPGSVRFRDRCGRSFAVYEGMWTITPREAAVTIGYELTARPNFDVPEFVLKRLLRRDAQQMIERLQAEMTARAARANM